VAKRKTFIALCTELTKLWNTLPEDITSAPFYWCSDENWRLICFGQCSRIRILCFFFRFQKNM